MKMTKYFSFIAASVCASLMLSGCVYAGNKGWDDMTVSEKQEVREELYNMRSEFKKDLSENASEQSFSDELALYIIDKIVYGIENAD